MHRIAVAIVIASFALSASANEIPQDAGSHSLFNPTPRALRRPLSADRPDFTESPYTVDAGAVQLEMSFVEYARNGDEHSWAVAPMNIKLGLFDDADVQFILSPHTRVDHGDAITEGFGDTQIRFKLNIWGNDGGDSAFAIMPFVHLPTGSSGLTTDHVEGGLIFPFSTSITEGVGLGLMFETDVIYDETDDAYDLNFITTGVLGLELSDAVGVYVEGIGITSTDSDQDFQGILGLGATYGLSEDVVFDVGFNIGLTGNSDDIVVFSGMTIRF